jgi:glycyl-tRNA synthetase
MEGKLDPKTAPGGWKSKRTPDGKPRHRGSGKDLTYFDDQTQERFTRT